MGNKQKQNKQKQNKKKQNKQRSTYAKDVMDTLDNLRDSGYYTKDCLEAMGKYGANTKQCIKYLKKTNKATDNPNKNNSINFIDDLGNDGYPRYVSNPEQEYWLPKTTLDNNIAKALNSDDTKSLKANFYRPKEFREDDELVLFGFVHEFESNFASSFFIPKAIIELIVTYYSWVDMWDVKYIEYFDINAMDKTIQRKQKYNCSVYTAFGERTTSKGLTVWNCKITAKGTVGRRFIDTIIGIINVDDIDDDDDMNKKGWTDFTSFGGYGLNTRNGQLLHTHAAGIDYTEPLKETDVICMLLNMNDEEMDGNITLRFFTNGIDKGYAFKHMPDGVYKLAVSMAQPDQIKLF